MMNYLREMKKMNNIYDNGTMLIGNVKMIKDMIKNGELTVGQLIWEYGTKKEPNWIHVSLPYSKKNQILYLYSK